MISEWNLYELLQTMSLRSVPPILSLIFARHCVHCTIGLLYLPSHNITFTRGVKSKIND